MNEKLQHLFGDRYIDTLSGENQRWVLSVVMFLCSHLIQTATMLDVLIYGKKLMAQPQIHRSFQTANFMLKFNAYESDYKTYGTWFFS